MMGDAARCACAILGGDDEEKKMQQTSQFYLLVLAKKDVVQLEVRQSPMNNGSEVRRRSSHRYAFAGQRLGLLTSLLSSDLPVEQDRLMDVLSA